MELYVDGDVDIYWTEGYPLAYPTMSTTSIEDFDDELYEELEEMGLLDED